MKKEQEQTKKEEVKDTRCIFEKIYDAISKFLHGDNGGFKI